VALKRQADYTLDDSGGFQTSPDGVTPDDF